MSLKNTIRFPVTQDDIDASICGNRRQCMIATAYKRVYCDAADHGYVVVDENGLGATHDGERRLYMLSVPTKRKAKEFDENKETAKPFTVHATLILTKDAKPKATRERKDQVNARRRERDAERKSVGLTPKRYARFV